jgi:DNA replication protein DnaC
MVKKFNTTVTMINELASELKLNAFKDIDKNHDVDDKTMKIICDLLVDQREIANDSKIQRTIKRAGFPFLKTMNTFVLDKEMYSDSIIEKINDIRSCNFINEQQDVVVIGPSGFGKTHLSIAIGLDAIRKNKKVIYRTASQIITEMDEAETNKKLLKYKSKLFKCDLLIIDDMGYVSFNSKSIKYLFDIISMRNEQKSTFVNSNLIFSEWTKNIKDANIMRAIVDRLSFNSNILFINNKNKLKGWRFSHSLSNRKIQHTPNKNTNKKK